jgi:predicted nuclease of restriction endonuclease-like (RecB) superfamily
MRSKNITIIDKEYKDWIADLSSRYRKSQIKAAVKVNQEMLKYYWELGRDVVEMHVEDRWGEGVINCLSRDLKQANPEITGLSVRSIYYCKDFYLLYSQRVKILPQVVAKIDDEILPQLGAKFKDANCPTSCGTNLLSDLFSVPWGHHRFIIDKCANNVDKALFFVRQTVENGWSRDVLLNFLDTDLYERHGKAITNFKNILPDETSDLAQQLTKDPYDFAFTGITGRYNERLLKDKLLNNITNFLIELGTGFAYVGKEYRLPIGKTENFIDLLFYNLKLRCYVVIEVKIGKFAAGDIGQIGTYIVAVNHQLRVEGKDNPTIGLLICRSKDNTQARYALESSSQPIGISEYELEQFYPEKVEGTIPTIEELEKCIDDKD